jgi:hypothetical protein
MSTNIPQRVGVDLPILENELKEEIQSLARKWNVEPGFSRAVSGITSWREC